MRTSNKQPFDSGQLGIFSQTCDCSAFTPYIHASESLAVRHQCSDADRISTVSCRDQKKDLFLDEVGGLDLDTINLSVSSPIIFSEYIPIVPRDMFKLSADEIPYDTVGIMINDILTKKIKVKHGFYSVPDGTKINRSVLDAPVFKGKKVILFSAGQDVLIETLWWDRHALELFKTISEMRFYAVTGMNFSLITGECPFGHALNMKKCLCYCEGLDKFGVPTIPHMYALNPYQRVSWKNWLTARPSIKMIVINTQLQRTQEQGMNDVFDTVRFLLENTSVEIIIHGRWRGIPKDIQTKYANRLHFASSGPLKTAVIFKGKSVREYIADFLSDIGLPNAILTKKKVT